jgi:FkbM family methyltransferase
LEISFDPEFAFLRTIAKPDWVVVDVGAAIGQFTIFAATLPAASVHAFEPSGLNVTTLQENVRRNGVADRVHIHPIAISNQRSEAYFRTNISTWCSGLSDTGTERVSVRELSDELASLGLEQVSVLKINVAGFEPQVLESADRFLSTGGADILILLLPWYARIASHGYRFFYFHPEEGALYQVTEFDADSVLEHRPWPARNIIAIHESAIDRLLDGKISIRKAGAGLIT